MPDEQRKISKVIFYENEEDTTGTVWMDVTQKTVTESNMLSGVTALKNDGTDIVGTLVPTAQTTLQNKTHIAPTTSSQTIVADDGYDGLSSVQIDAMPSGSVTAPSTINGTSATITTGTNTLTLSKTVSVTPNVTSAGYISGGIAGNAAVSLTASVTTKGATTYNVSSSNQTIDASQYLTGAQTIRAVTTAGISAENIKDGTTITVGDSGSATRIANVTGTFTDATTVSSGQTAATASQILSGYSAWVDGTEVKGNIATKSSLDLSASDATVNVPAGYYASTVSKAVASGTEGTPTATKGTVSNHSVAVTPSVTNTAGYISGGTQTGTGVTVSASELVSGSETKTSNGTYDVTNLAQLVVNVSGGGSTGLEYETGTYTPANNTARPELTFSNTHTNKPLMAAIYDITNTEITTSHMSAATMVLDWEGTTGNVIHVGGDVGYGMAMNGYESSDRFTNARRILSSDSTSSSSGTGYYLSNTAFKPGSISIEQYQAGRTYKWLAVWAPTT